VATSPLAQPTLIGERVTLRPLRDSDRARLREILAEPGVAHWWGSGGADRAVAELFDRGLHVAFAVQAGGELIGSIQYSEESDPDYRHAGIDIFLDSAHRGQGLGPDALRTLARHLLADRGHHRLTIDPATSNGRAIAAYLRVGFKPVGVMRAYERGPDGSFHDNLLLDLLDGELR